MNVSSSTYIEVHIMQKRKHANHLFFCSSIEGLSEKWETKVFFLQSFVLALDDEYDEPWWWSWLLIKYWLNVVQRDDADEDVNDDADVGDDDADTKGMTLF